VAASGGVSLLFRGSLFQGSVENASGVSLAPAAGHLRRPGIIQKPEFNPVSEGNG
jgi:hypothetical protein